MDHAVNAFSPAMSFYRGFGPSLLVGYYCDATYISGDESTLSNCPDDGLMGTPRIECSVIDGGETFALSGSEAYSCSKSPPPLDAGTD
jgi:hypothetical protein